MVSVAISPFIKAEAHWSLWSEFPELDNSSENFNEKRTPPIPKLARIQDFNPHEIQITEKTAIATRAIISPKEIGVESKLYGEHIIGGIALALKLSSQRVFDARNVLGIASAMVRHAGIEPVSLV